MPTKGFCSRTPLEGDEGQKGRLASNVSSVSRIVSK
jgi:hypothetical protein